MASLIDELLRPYARTSGQHNDVNESSRYVKLNSETTRVDVGPIYVRHVDVGPTSVRR